MTDFIADCRQEFRRWIGTGMKGGISPDLMAEIREKTLLELADFAKSKFPAISEDHIWQSARDIRLAKQAAERCNTCRILPEACPTGGYTVELVARAEYFEAIHTKCSKREIIPVKRRGG